MDFKYSSSPRVTWWFDHHQSAFLTPEDEAEFRRGQVNGDGTPGPEAMRKFFDRELYLVHGPDRGGCEHEVWDGYVEPLRELIYWANIVDGAKYESAKDAVEMRGAGDEADDGDRELDG